MTTRLEVFDPAMCCSTGVCGPTGDPALARVAADLEWLREHGVAVSRHNLAQEPDAFVSNATVRAALESGGVARLPMVLANGRLLSEGAYPSRAALARAAGLAADASEGRRTLEVEFLALDLETCDRCSGTKGSLEAALEKTADRLREIGVDVAVRTTVVRSLEQAEALGFASSPTIRVDGRDIALERKESPCGCGDAAGTRTDCRVWVYRGREYTVAPEEMIVEAILAAAAGPAPTSATTPARVPENIRRYLTARAGVTSDCCAPPSRASKPRVAKGRCC